MAPVAVFASSVNLVNFKRVAGNSTSSRAEESTSGTSNLTSFRSTSTTAALTASITSSESISRDSTSTSISDSSTSDSRTLEPSTTISTSVASSSTTSIESLTTTSSQTSFIISEQADEKTTVSTSFQTSSTQTTSIQTTPIQTSTTEVPESITLSTEDAIPTIEPTYFRGAIQDGDESDDDIGSTVVLVSTTSTQYSDVVSVQGTRTFTSSAALTTFTSVVPSTIPRASSKISTAFPMTASPLNPDPGIPSGALSTQHIEAAVTGGLVAPIVVIGVVLLTIFIRRRRFGTSSNSVAQKHNTIQTFLNPKGGQSRMSVYRQSELTIGGAPSMGNPHFSFRSTALSEPDRRAYQVPDDLNPFRDPRPDSDIRPGLAL